MVGAARAAGRRYDGLLKSHKLTVTTISGAVLAAAGDACTQAATSEGGKPLAYDAKRGLTFALFGALVTGPINCFWLTRLDTVVRWLAPAGGRIATSAKVATQTFFFQPIVCAPCGLSNPRLRLAPSPPARTPPALTSPLPSPLGGSDVPLFFGVSDLAQQPRRDYATTVKSVWGFWTPIVIFAFTVLAGHRLLVGTG